ncbi:MAG: hypothetical protein U0P45_12565 [Acidimicrobiales bacterium]
MRHSGPTPPTPAFLARRGPRARGLAVALVASAALASCSSAGASSAPPTTAGPAAGAPTEARPSAACRAGEPHPAAATDGRLYSSGHGWRYTLEVPPSSADDARGLLVVVGDGTVPPSVTDAVGADAVVLRAPTSPQGVTWDEVEARQLFHDLTEAAELNACFDTAKVRFVGVGDAASVDASSDG